MFKHTENGLLGNININPTHCITLSLIKEEIMKNLTCKVVGNNEIRINNPQSADPLNKYAKAMKEINAIHHTKKTDADREKLEHLSIESKLYFNDNLGVWIPSTWVMAGLGGVSFKLVGIGKKVIREGVFMNQDKLKLSYSGMQSVKKIEDVVLNPDFKTVEFHTIDRKKIAKGTPKFDNWSFNIDIDFDEEVITEQEIVACLKMMVTRKGFGDFRPTYGRGQIEDLIITECEF